MKTTLYQQVREIESIDETLRGLDSSSKTDVLKLQRELFKKYEENPVLYDAIKGKQTIGESLEELSQINKGIRKILPWRKDKSHNKRLKQLGELVSEPYHLRADGIFNPDNLITVGAETMAVVIGLGYLLSKYLITLNPELSPEELQEMLHLTRVIVPVATSAVAAPILGLVSNVRRFDPLPRHEAKYLDKKVTEFYK